MEKIITKENIDTLPTGLLQKEEVQKELMQNPYGKYLVLIEENQVVAYLYYSDIYERSEINQFEVKKEKRNQGLGNLLLQKFLNIEKKPITLEVRKNNEIAIHLYEKYGFSKKATRKNYYPGVDGWLMEKNKSP